MTKPISLRRNRGVIDRVVRGRLAKTKRIMHGGRAQNEQLPKRLQRKTVDWDIFAKNPRKAARNMERALDKKFKGDAFRVKPGKTKSLGVMKVVSNETGEGFVDYAKPDRMVQTVSKRGVRMASLKDQKTRATMNLKDPERAFRRAKDLEFLGRIKKFEKIRGKKI